MFLSFNTLKIQNKCYTAKEINNFNRIFFLTVKNVNLFFNLIFYLYLYSKKNNTYTKKKVTLSNHLELNCY